MAIASCGGGDTRDELTARATQTLSDVSKSIIEQLDPKH